MLNPQMNRQYPMVAVFAISLVDFGTDTDMVVGSLPMGAIINESFIEGDEAFDTSALTVASTNSPLTIAGLGVGSIARVDATVLGITTGTSEITVTRSTDTDTTGNAYLIVSYVEAGRANEVQP